MFQSVRSKLLAGIIVPLVIFYCIIAATETQRQMRFAIADAEQSIKESTERRAERIKCELVRFFSTLKLLKGYIEDHPEVAADELDRIFTRYIKDNPQLLGILIAYDPLNCSDRKDKILYIHRDKDKIEKDTMPDGYDYYRDPYMIPSITREEFWAEPYINIAPSKQLICTFSAPFFYNKKFSGCLIAYISLERIRQIVQSNTPENSQFTMISPTGTIISDNSPELELNETVFSLAEQFGRKELADWGHRILKNASVTARFKPANNSLPEKMIWNNKSSVWITSVHLEDTNWILAVAFDENMILKPVYVWLKQQIILFTFGLLVIVCIICFVSLRLTDALKHLTNFAAELAGGNLDAKVKGKHSNDEFGHLADAFDKMSVELKSDINRLIQETAARKTIEEELRAARRIQTSLLPGTFPPFPDRPEFDLHAKNEPAAFIAGDFYDFFFVSDSVIAIVMADVSGHGIPAALFMAVSRTSIRNSAANSSSAKEIINRVNFLLSKGNDDCMFVTVFFGLYNIHTGELCYVNAGHNPPYILRSDGSLIPLPAAGPVMAVIENTQYEEKTVILYPKDVIITFTDGVTEAYRNDSKNNHIKKEEKFFGESRLETLLQQVRNATAEEICNAIFSAVEAHDGGEHQDDVTILVLKRSQLV